MKSISKCKKWLKKTIKPSTRTTHPTSSPISSTLSEKEFINVTTLPPAQDWRMLSPDQPPLPTVFPRTDDNVVTAGAALSPMFEHRPFAFTPLTTTQQLPHQHQHHQQQQRSYPLITDYCSRPLDPILEESETMTSNHQTNTTDESPFDSKNNSASSFLQQQQQQQQQEDDPLPSPQLDQQQQQQHHHHHHHHHLYINSPTSNSLSTLSTSSCHSPPRTINNTIQFDEFGSSIVGNELYCKRKFSKMVQAAYHFQTTSNLPTTMQALCDELDTIKLTLFNGLESNCSFTGNPQYIPPEMFIRQSNTRGSSDVWVLGISLYRMLVGTFPFKSTNDRQLITKMLNADFIIPDHFSEDLKDLLRRMLAPEQTRASFDLIMFHPWLKPYRRSVVSSPTTLPDKPVLQPKKKPKWRRILKKTYQFILLGPYPPPSRPYQELAHLGK